MDSNPQVSAISDGVMDLLSDMLSHLSTQLKDQKGYEVSAEEMAAMCKLPRRPGVITPPYLRNTGPSVAAPSVPSSGRRRGTKERCPFLLTKGVRKNEPCARPASKPGRDGKMYCGSHIGKIGAATEGVAPATVQHQIPGPNVPTPMVAPIANGTSVAPVATSQREISVDPLKDTEGTPIPGKYLEKDTQLVIEATGGGGGTVVGKWENDVIRKLNAEEILIAKQMGLGYIEESPDVAAVPAM